MAKKWPNLVQSLHFWSFWAKYCHFLHILSNARPKNNANKVPRWVFRYVSNKTFDFSSKKRIFCPETTKFGPNLAFLTIAGSFGALLMGWLVVVARGLYLARHLFTLSYCEQCPYSIPIPIWSGNTNQLLQLLVLKVANPGAIFGKYEDPYILIMLGSSNRKD